jgi:hypothetical protein
MLQTVWQSVQNVVSRMPMPLEAIQNRVIAAEIAAALLGIMIVTVESGARLQSGIRSTAVWAEFTMCAVCARVNFEVADGHSSLSIQKSSKPVH